MFEVVPVVIPTVTFVIHCFDFVPSDGLGSDYHTLYDTIAGFDGYGLVREIVQKCEIFIFVATVKRVNDTYAV